VNADRIPAPERDRHHGRGPNQQTPQDLDNTLLQPPATISRSCCSLNTPFYVQQIRESLGKGEYGGLNFLCDSGTPSLVNGFWQSTVKMIFFAIVASKCNYPDSDGAIRQKKARAINVRAINDIQPTSISNPPRFLLAICALFCLGLACSPKSSSHRVTLSWKAPRAVPGVSIAGYNVYRSTVSGQEFVRLASRVPGPPYEDRLVSSGRSYFYVVTSVDQAGRESRFSSEAQAMIP
jgi:hypothetical protein